MDERRVLKAFGEEATWPNNPVRTYEDVTAGLSLSVAYPSLLSLVRAGYVTHLTDQDGYVLTMNGFTAVENLQNSRLDG